MTSLFTSVLNMSITASYVAIAVIIIRLFLKKVPKVFSYVLWLPVLIRLVFLFTFNSNFSFFSFLKTSTQTSSGALEYVPNNIGFMQNPTVDVGINGINNTVNTILPTATPYASVNPMQIIIGLASIIWVVGILILLGYSIISYLMVKSNVKTATLVKDNIFETAMITTPFVCGFIRPRIFVPVGISQNELSYILEHEQVHINRLDYLIKPFAFLVLIIHWFNPLMWISFALMSKDMEMSCDESVLKKMGNDIRGNYANSLLSLSVKRSTLLTGSPLAFSESKIKSRIKNILSYKKPALGVIAVIIVIVAALILVFTANPKTEQSSHTMYSKYDITSLISNKTLYVGNFSKVSALFNAMPLPEGIVRGTFELQTEKPPYGITINLSMKDASNVTEKGAISTADFYRISVLLFSLIDNVDIINYKMVDVTDKNSGATYGFTYTRKMTEKLMGEDVRNFGDSTANLKILIDRLKGMSVDATVTTDYSDTAIAASTTTAVATDTTTAIDTVTATGTTPKVAIDKIEKYLEIIISPNASSNPNDYIKAHDREYESILKMGDIALNYLLTQFKEGAANNDLRGHIIMALCKELLGDRNNVTDESLSPQGWFLQLKLYEEIQLGDFHAKVSDPLEQLVYDTAVKQYSTLKVKQPSQPYHGFTVVAPTIYGNYEEGNKLKVIVTVFSSRYRMYGKTLSEVGGSVIPAAITYTKNSDGSYTLDKYIEARDGSYFGKSIKEFCVMPVSKKEIKGLYDKLLADYGSNKDRSELLMKNLIEHLKTNNQKDIVLKGLAGELIPLT
jgi:beta-lactamase regulating signal transducer with metallopeptidase domain